VVQVLEFLAAHPDRSYTLVEVANGLGLNRATCTSIIEELVDAGWIVRRPNRTYSLGIALLVLGRAAEAAEPAVHLARLAIHEVVAATGIPGAVVLLEHDRIKVVDSVGDDGGAAVVPGRELPFAAPFGISFVAWDADGFQGWLDRSTWPLEDEDRRWFERAAASVRARGYGVEYLNEMILHLRNALADAVNGPADAWIEPVVQDVLQRLPVRTQVIDLDVPREDRVPVNVLYAPVFDERGRAFMNLSLHPVAPLADAELDGLGRTLVEHAAAVTRATGGRLPDLQQAS
jgi:DNA-binding IclR family transcriptional regulator